MAKIFGVDDICQDLWRLGISEGDTILVRADLGKVGRIKGGSKAFIEALLCAVGKQGTLVSLAFTSGYSLLNIKQSRNDEVFTAQSKSYAGSLPNAMLSWPGSKRSLHPMCSYVAIGKDADIVTRGHDEKSLAYEPIRRVIELNGKNVLIGCVSSSPGFTTAHLAESDLGYLRKLPIFPRLRCKHYQSKDGSVKVFRRRDPGLCSASFYKFYSHYVLQGVLCTGLVGSAYSIAAPSHDCYKIEYELLKANQKFNLCDSPNCFVCNAGRWDQVHMLPGFLLRRLFKRLQN
jgi:aminoglycoside N3'-acetyltransferase